MVCAHLLLLYYFGRILDGYQMVDLVSLMSTTSSY
jgi:hypothetical protein